MLSRNGITGQKHVYIDGSGRSLRPRENRPAASSTKPSVQMISLSNTAIACAAAPAIMHLADHISYVSRVGLSSSLVIFGILTTGGDRGMETICMGENCVICFCNLSYGEVHGGLMKVFYKCLQGVLPTSPCSMYGRCVALDHSAIRARAQVRRFDSEHRHPYHKPLWEAQVRRPNQIHHHMKHECCEPF